MLKETLIEFYERDLQKLATEISLYKNEDNLWVIKAGISNCGGNLCLHLLGNLNHFIGATIGNTGYIRHRDDEFSLKNIPRQDLLMNISNCILIVKESLGKLSEEALKQDFPLKYNDKIVSSGNMLVHLLAHLSYHLGQINYHRRLIENN